jgi:hypothetical protein
MVERDIALRRTAAAVAPRAQGARHRSKRRNVLGIVPLVELTFVLGCHAHRVQQQGGRVSPRQLVPRQNLFALIAHQQLDAGHDAF